VRYVFLNKFFVTPRTSSSFCSATDSEKKRRSDLLSRCRTLHIEDTESLHEACKFFKNGGSPMFVTVWYLSFGPSASSTLLGAISPTGNLYLPTEMRALFNPIAVVFDPKCRSTGGNVVGGSSTPHIPSGVIFLWAGVCFRLWPRVNSITFKGCEVQDSKEPCSCSRAYFRSNTLNRAQSSRR